MALITSSLAPLPVAPQVDAAAELGATRVGGGYASDITRTWSVRRDRAPPCERQRRRRKVSPHTHAQIHDMQQQHTTHTATQRTHIAQYSAHTLPDTAQTHRPIQRKPIAQYSRGWRESWNSACVLSRLLPTHAVSWVFSRPCSGTFSQTQRQIHDVVNSAVEAGIANAVVSRGLQLQPLWTISTAAVSSTRVRLLCRPAARSRWPRARLLTRSWCRNAASALCVCFHCIYLVLQPPSWLRRRLCPVFSTAFVAKTPPLPNASTAFTLCFPLPSQLRHRLCLAFPLPPWLRHRLCLCELTAPVL